MFFLGILKVFIGCLLAYGCVRLLKILIRVFRKWFDELEKRT